MVIHDLKCHVCGHESYDVPLDVNALPFCSECHGPMEIRWDISRRPIQVATGSAVHSSERAVVWRHPLTGSVAYPGMNNAPMPERYRKSGYERVELDSLHKLDKFSKENNVSSEIANFDKSGHADDL